MKHRPRPKVGKNKEVRLSGPLAGLRRARIQMEQGNPAAGNTVVGGTKGGDKAGGQKVTVMGPTPGKSTSRKFK